jgi:mannose-6-phosphate isomerase-like protein (cupin superfamily)
MSYRVIRPDDLDWEERPQQADEAPRHVAPLTDLAGFEHTRANLWRYEPGSYGRRHTDHLQEETFVALEGTLTMYLGEPPVREEVPAGGLVHVAAGTPLQIANEGAEDLLLYAYGAPPERGQAEFLASAV